MQILAYGEDALTLWAIKDKLPAILQTINDSTALSHCRVFFRPSFGRKGGEHRSEFGEFDFILLTQHCICLGESKWDQSSERIVDGVLDLRVEQLLRHKVFRFYIEEWAFGNYDNWREFIRLSQPKLGQRGIIKPIAPANSRLAANLQEVLGVIRHFYTALPIIKDVLLYFYNSTRTDSPPKWASEDFVVVSIDYAEGLSGNFIQIEE